MPQLGREQPEWSLGPAVAAKPQLASGCPEAWKCKSIGQSMPAAVSRVYAKLNAAKRYAKLRLQILMPQARAQWLSVRRSFPASSLSSPIWLHVSKPPGNGVT